MKTEIVKEDGPCRVTVSTEVTAEEVAAIRKRVNATFAKRVRLPGFRPGKVPMARIEALYGKDIQQAVNQEIIDAVVSDSQKFLDEQGREMARVVELKDFKAEPGQAATLTAILDLAPRFDLPEEAKWQVKKVDAEVSDEMLEARLADVRKMAASFRNAEGEETAAEEDLAEISFTSNLSKDSATRATGCSSTPTPSSPASPRPSAARRSATPSPWTSPIPRTSVSRTSPTRPSTTTSPSRPSASTSPPTMRPLSPASTPRTWTRSARTSRTASASSASTRKASAPSTTSRRFRLLRAPRLRPRPLDLRRALQRRHQSPRALQRRPRGPSQGPRLRPGPGARHQAPPPQLHPPGRRQGPQHQAHRRGDGRCPQRAGRPPPHARQGSRPPPPRERPPEPGHRRHPLPEGPQRAGSRLRRALSALTPPRRPGPPGRPC